jgi:hypothetical protein
MGFRDRQLQIHAAGQFNSWFRASFRARRRISKQNTEAGAQFHGKLLSTKIITKMGVENDLATTALRA